MFQAPEDTLWFKVDRLNFLLMMRFSIIYNQNFKNSGNKNVFHNITGKSLNDRETFKKATSILSREYSAPMIAKEIESLKKGES